MIKTFCQVDSCNFSCSADLNKDEMFISEVPKLEFQKIVVPSIFSINVVHARAYLNYTIPFDTLSNALGLSLIFGYLFPPCADCNSSNLCAQDVKFHKILGTSCASFIWNSKSPVEIIKDKVIDHYKYEIRLPRVINGMAQISPNFLKVQFHSEVRFIVWDMSTIVAGKPKVLIDYVINGIESTAWHAVVFPSCSKRPFIIPYLPIYLHPIK